MVDLKGCGEFPIFSMLKLYFDDLKRFIFGIRTRPGADDLGDAVIQRWKDDAFANLVTRLGLVRRPFRQGAFNEGFFLLNQVVDQGLT